MRVVLRAVIARVHGDDLRAHRLRRSDVRGHDGERVVRVGNQHHGAEWENRLAARQRRERRHHEVDALPHREQIGDGLLIEYQHGSEEYGLNGGRGTRLAFDTVEAARQTASTPGGKPWTRN